MARPRPSGRLVVLTVHGTGDIASEDHGQKWWQLGSPFVSELGKQLRRAGHDPEFVFFRWSGANNMLEREEATYRQVKFLKQLNKKHGPVHLVGHSHGGTIANDAAIQLSWGHRRAGGEFIASMTTVGTPYLHRDIGWMEKWGASAFYGLALLCTAILGIFVLGSLYLSIKYTERLVEAGLEPSDGSVGDCYDNALAETINGLYKAEVIWRQGPWRSLEAVEYAALEWVDWYNNRRLLEPIGNIPPAEAEAAYYADQEGRAIAA